tara:strand:+ start:51 stop:290 length:240 start_codon:yes stop_codon:yes gene_type:complete
MRISLKYLKSQRSKVHEKVVNFGVFVVKVIAPPIGVPIPPIMNGDCITGIVLSLGEPIIGIAPKTGFYKTGLKFCVYAI